ncbi:MAG TPA: RAMP superfamily CRISPR-associated protein, partial [Thermotogota bacterium]|nr:RAMP superfamily CRISPR-associated protein [Thermotogota bacterium]
MPELEKGYFRIDIPRVQVSPTRPFLEKFSGRCGKIIIRWKTLQPFSITNGVLTLTREQDKTEPLYRFYRLGDVLIFPGSAFKGMARTYTAAIFGLDFADELYGDCDYGVTDRDQNRRNNKINHASKVFFDDALLKTKQLTKQPTMEAFSKNKTKTNTFRIYQLKKSEEMKTQSYDMECFPAGVSFVTEIQYMGLLDEHFHAFFLSLGLHSRYHFPLKCGRGKSTGYGAIKASLEIVTQFDEKCPFSPLKDVTEAVKKKLTE